ncbi:hypothetical protein AVL63_06910 [Nesterenkonia jeotgali]|uniref:Uncharacterized protein n=1 Tax=Nesterenkonia jeotgali TaxID=317018 RepID=A0A0W8IEK6_9MICC|nr:hypothetical protein AVL63_06910 [Nesterenkonia jeotgali]
MVTGAEAAAAIVPILASEVNNWAQWCAGDLAQVEALVETSPPTAACISNTMEPALHQPRDEPRRTHH